MSKKRTYRCTHCNKEFQRYPSLSPNTKAYFCSRSCNRAHGQVVVNCSVCGAVFTVKKSRSKRDQQTLCCSYECKFIAQAKIQQGRVTRARIPLTCKQCGKTRMVFPCYADRLFCGKKCHAIWKSEHECGESNINWRGGYKEYYGPNWRAQRSAARQRDNHHCQACGTTERKLKRALDVHHVTPFRMFGYITGKNERYKDANRLENLISLCASCHTLVEHGILSVQLKLL